MSHYARFTGFNNAKRYGYTEDYRGVIGKVHEFYQPIPYDPWSENLIYEGRLDDPVLESGKRIRLHTLNKTVDILKVERSTNGVYTYLTNYEIEKIEDEVTQATKEHAELRKKHADDKWDRMSSNRSEPLKLSWWEQLKRMFS